MSTGRTSFTKWYDQVLPDMPSCPKNIVLNAIKLAAVDFCERSRAWHAVLEKVTPTATEDHYDIPTPRKTAVVRVERFWYQGRELEVKNEDELTQIYRNDWRDVTGTPKFVTQLDPESFYLVPKPTATVVDAVALTVSLKPTRDATDLPSWIYERHLEAISNGARARLLAMPKKPWTDLALAGVYSSAADAQIGAANVDAFKAFGRARPRGKPVWV